MAENIYPKGLFFNKNHPDTPDAVKKWKKGGVAIHIENFIAHLNEVKSYADDKGYLKYDLCENEKDGKKFLSFKLNTYKPSAPSPRTVEEDVPFN